MRTGLTSIGDAIGEMPIISKRKYEFLKTHESTLTPDEKNLVSLFEEVKKENANKVYGVKEVETPKVERLEQIPLNYMTRQFKMHWEFNEKKELVVNDFNRKEIIALCKYFARLDGPLDRSKGILLMGGTGSGKTSIMNAFHTLGEAIYKQRGDMFMRFLWSNCIDLVDEFEDMSTDKALFFQNYRGAHRMFDDFGQEADASRFGLKNLMKEIIEKRYHRLRWRTFLTTNLTGDQIKEKYGFRVHSRIHEMFNVVPLIGDDFRTKN